MSTKTILLIIILIGAALGVSYVNTRQAIQTAIVEMDMQLIDVVLQDYTLLPPSAEIELVYNVSNPTEYDLSVDIEFDSYLGDSYLNSYSSMNQFLAAHSSSNIYVRTQLGANMLTAFITNLERLGDEDLYNTNGTIRVTHELWGIIPITYTYLI